jgi:hypothetical protein
MNRFSRAWLLLLLGACAGPAEATVTVKPPPPVATPVDAPAPAPPSPPSPAPPPAAPATTAVPLRAEALGVNGELHVGPEGALAEASAALLDRLAAALSKRNDLEVVAVAAFLPSGGEVPQSQARADAVADALAQRGVDRKRLDPRGFGSRCGGDGRVELVIVRRSGKDTGTPVGCR